MKNLLFSCLALLFIINGQAQGNLPGVTIGNQIWMRANLNVSKYRNGDTIPQAKDSTEWKNLTTGAWCYYRYDSNNEFFYGKLYNWYAVNDPRGLAPDGWHIPSDAEWTTLINYLGGENVAGGKMKNVGISNPQRPNVGATNTSGFTAKLGGFCNVNGAFGQILVMGYWWSATGSNTKEAWERHLYLNFGDIGRGDSDKKSGYAVRCIKD